MKDATMVWTVCAGLGLTAAVATVLLSNVLVNQNFRLKAALLKKTLFARKGGEEESKEAFVQFLAGLVMGILFLGIGDTLRNTVLLFMAGVCVGILGAKIYQNISKSVRHDRLLKEIARLFEAVEMSVRAGFTPVQALKASAMLVPHMQKDINKCVARWPSGFKQALRQLQEDLKIPEAGILVGLLTQLEIAGKENLTGVLGREARNIEQMRKMKAEVKIAARPLYLFFYQLLPLLIILGLVLGPFLFRLSNEFKLFYQKGGF